MTADKELNGSLLKHVNDREGHDRRYAIDPKKIYGELGWEPLVNFDDGIRKTVKWYLNNQKWMKQVTNGEYIKYYEKMYSLR